MCKHSERTVCHHAPPKGAMLRVDFTDCEVCSGETVPEVEIISLLEEQIPRYKLRADTLTKFGGYENQDWFIPTPALQVEDIDLKLSPDQIRETLNYFLLCSNRVSQMTKTYDDIEAVTRLLEEKEKDLELTARIGKELLQQNTKLEKTVETLEADLKSANEKITQLSHEIVKKTELIQILTNDMDESCLENGMAIGKINLDLLQKRIGSLEDENKALKSEYCRLADDTDDIEARERQLVNDITGQLACANSSMTLLEDELDRQKDENRQQHEQILALTAKLEDTEMRLHKIMTEHEEATTLLQLTRDTQNSLALELADFKSRYLEVEALLRETQEQLKKARRRYMPSVRSSFFPSLGSTNQSVPFDSLQSELEMSMHSELSADSGFSSGEPVPYFKKVFETVRCASQNSMSSADSMSNYSMMGVGGCVTSSGGARMSVKPQDPLRRSSGSIYSSSSLGYPSLDSTGQSDNEYGSQTDSEECYPGPPQKGVPGVPGATELEAALKRLTPAEVAARRINLQHGTAFSGYESDPCLPYGCRTPDSLMSTGSGNYHGWRLPEKLQIVKPMEGSLTLHQWSQLAQPTFSGLLEERPGVKIRGGKELEDMGVESYVLSDLEEDEEYSNPGKGFESSAPIYTLTNSTVMHPDDGTFVTPSERGSRMTSVCSSIQNSPPQTPLVRSRRNSTSTFSTTLGLAKMLNERGIKAVTPSAVATPCGPNSFTPTATPCNSPDGSPLRSGSPEPDAEHFSIPQLIFSSVPAFLQQTVGGGAIKKTSLSKRRLSKSGTNEGLVGRIERIGISNLMGAPNALSISAAMYARPALTSPMAQLTCLLPSNNPVQKEKEALKNEDVHPQTSAKPPTGLGVPAKPGSGALNSRLEQLNSRRQRRQGTVGMTRPDLGTVTTNKKPAQTEQSFVGTLSSLLFGRKGGLF
ncbi:trafficking kinesin-binding protein milt isoform X2 [Agrilus planipennis]|uniref:Trafficking kinesin-binding protein milt isoform X2 n=1 Tax=Agrilus planipennis TaxID=224129 RepID=A0A7F5R827_AGRPL|nr:trafficking kinesin-binding protein milt isoform X2 [Agrilus planipennis]